MTDDDEDFIRLTVTLWEVKCEALMCLDFEVSDRGTWYTSVGLCETPRDVTGRVEK